MKKEKTILFLHGFYASGHCVPAVALREAFEKGGTPRPGESRGGYLANVLTPDLPLHPHDAIRLIRDICDKEKPDVLVGNSCGSFYAQMISPIVGIPALLGNPHFKMSDFLHERIGSHQYKSPRADGKQDFTIDEQLISEFEELEVHQFDCCNIYNKDRVWGIIAEDRVRYFQHFKGNKYKMIASAFDSETQERMVVYQALYGDRKYWVRPEKMFFEQIERDGKRFSRFQEIDWEE